MPLTKAGREYFNTKVQSYSTGVIIYCPECGDMFEKELGVFYTTNPSRVFCSFTCLHGGRHIFACTDAWRLGRPCVHEKEALNASSTTT